MLLDLGTELRLLLLNDTPVTVSATGLYPVFKPYNFVLVFRVYVAAYARIAQHSIFLINDWGEGWLRKGKQSWKIYVTVMNE